VFNDYSVNQLMGMVFYFVSNMCMSWFNYHSIPWINGNLASAEKCSGSLRSCVKTGFTVWLLGVSNCKQRSHVTASILHVTQSDAPKSSASDENSEKDSYWFYCSAWVQCGTHRMKACSHSLWTSRSCRWPALVSDSYGFFLDAWQEDPAGALSSALGLL
jgi:hypothetical protein